MTEITQIYSNNASSSSAVSQVVTNIHFIYRKMTREITGREKTAGDLNHMIIAVQSNQCHHYVSTNKILIKLQFHSKFLVLTYQCKHGCTMSLQLQTSPNIL